MKFVVIALAFLIVGFVIGNYYGERNVVAPLEVGTVRDAALDVRLKIVVLQSIRESKYGEAIRTLESSLTVDEALLQTCWSSTCKSVTNFESSDTEALLKSYRQKYGPLATDP